MGPQDVDPDPLPPDPVDVMRARIDRILRDLGLDGPGDPVTIQRRALIAQLEELACGVVAIHEQREVRDLRRKLDSAFEASATQIRVIRALVKVSSYYGDRQNWRNGCPVHVNPFDEEDVQLDWGECAQDALRFVQTTGVLPL